MTQGHNSGLVVTIAIPGRPVPYARTDGGKSGHRFTPARQRAKMAAIRQLAELEMRGRAPLSGPVWLTMRSIFPIPKGWTISEKAAAMTGEKSFTSRPDVSNLVKLVEDAICGVVYVDDAQIVQIDASKAYGPDPLTVVTVRAV